jgi:hypothetical protein
MRTSGFVRLRVGPAIVAMVLLSASNLTAQSQDAIVDVVAVGRAQGRVLLATPTDQPEWRVREIPLPRGNTRASEAVLSPTGTKLAVAIDFGTYVLDLTTKLPVWCEGMHFHQLPDTIFPIVRDGRLSIIEDGSIDECTDRELVRRFVLPRGSRTSVGKPVQLRGTAYKARRSRTGGVLFWTAANRLFQLRDTEEIEVSGAIDGEILDLVPSATDGPIEFVLISKTNHGLTARSVTRDRGGTFAVGKDTLFTPSSTLTDQQLLAALHLSGRNTETAPRFVVSEKYRQPSIEWTFWPVEVDPRLYAPVLQFDGAEQIRPHRTDIWRRADVYNEAGLLEWYGRLSADQRKPWVYYRVTGYPGSWLIEYWTYYPIDNGHVGSHAHDTEHVFVEVDKLGGAPRAILAAAHLDSSPNNVYSSLDPSDAEWPTLPLFAFVELGKHALAPDVNRDGFFTAGRDVNGYREVAHLWGIRDYIGRTDDHFNTFRESMMVPRLAEYRLPVMGFSRYFPSFHTGVDIPKCDANSTLCAYELQELPSLASVRQEKSRLETEIKQAESAGYAALNAKLAEKKLKFHDDALDPDRIYRTRVFPDTALRVGGGYDWYQPPPQISVGLAVSLARPFGIHMPIPIPGRLAVEGIGHLTGTEKDVTLKVLESGVYVERPVRRQFGRSLQLGLRYERMTSNMFGFFFGVHRQFQSEIKRPGTPIEREVPIREFWFRLGPMYESKWANVQVGPAWNWDHLLFEIRGTYVIKAWKGRSRFGIRN